MKKKPMTSAEMVARRNKLYGAKWRKETAIKASMAAKKAREKRAKEGKKLSTAPLA